MNQTQQIEMLNVVIVANNYYICEVNKQAPCEGARNYYDRH